MGRPLKSLKAARAAKADWDLRSDFPDLYDAIDTWQANSDVDTLAEALEGLSIDPLRIRGSTPSEDAPRAERIRSLAVAYRAASQVGARLDSLRASVEARRSVIHAELIAAACEPTEVMPYEQLFIERLNASDIKQADLHTGGRKLAIAVADFIRQFNKERRDGGKPTAPENYADKVPLASWSDLPRAFAGVVLIDVDAADALELDVCPLPPSTDIATFTEDGHQPALLETRLETVVAWSKIIDGWRQRNNSTLSPLQRAIWALLLGHYMRPDTTNLSNLEAVELASPWKAGGIVRLKAQAPGKHEAGTVEV